MGLRCDGYPSHSMFFDDALHQSRLLNVLGELAQESRGGFTFLGGADRLLHTGDLPVQNARAGMFFRVCDEARLEAGERVELLIDEQLVRAVDALRAHQLSLFYISR